MYINVILKAKWQLKINSTYKVTDCKRVVNSKTGKILKYNTRGYYIDGKYYKKNDINNMIELIPYIKCPF